MTAADRPTRSGAGSSRSVRQLVAGLPGPLVGLGLLIVAAEVFGGWRVLGPDWQGGDLLYHSALANAILRGELPPGGPYAGLPTYYPPGFHVMLAVVMGALDVGSVRADQLLHLAWLPVLPIGTFLLVRRVTGRPWVAVLAAALTLFGGAYDLSAGRLWVNSLFMVGHETYPLYPRDVVFALLPFGLLAYLRALAAARWRALFGWALVAGGLFGLCALVQVQLLLPIPFALGAVALVVALRRPDRRAAAVAVLAVSGVVGIVLLAPWLVPQLEAIRRNGGIALASSDMLVPARFGPWSYPREFGLLLPLGLLGAGVALLFLRRRDGPRPAGGAIGRWRPAAAEDGLGLVTWFGLAFALGVLYQPDWPLEDALRPQRLWLLAGQPMAMLAAIGLVTVAEDLVGRLRPARIAPRTAIVGLVAVTTLVACVPTTVATARLLAGTWTTPTYAALDLEVDRVPSFAAILPTRGPRATVLTYEDWSSLAWYETGATVVGLVPAGFAKLAYDPGVFTGRSQVERRADLLRAFDGDPADLAAVAATGDAAWVVLARRGEALGLFDAAAAPSAARPGSLSGTTRTVEGNGWDALALEAGAALELPLKARRTPSMLTVGQPGTVHLEIRVAGAQAGAPAPPRRLSLTLVGQDGSERPAGEVVVPATSADPWQVVAADVDPAPGDRLRLGAIDALTVQSIRGFVATGEAIAVGTSPVPGWRIAIVTPDAVVMEPVR